MVERKRKADQTLKCLICESHSQQQFLANIEHVNVQCIQQLDKLQFLLIRNVSLELVEAEQLMT